MKLAVFGASGATGLLLLDEALARGHDVTAFVRRPSSIRKQHERLRVVQGDALDREAVAGTVRGQDAVISSLGSRPWRSTPVCSVGTANIVDAMGTAGASRFVCISSIGVGESKAAPAGLARLVAATVLRGVLADKEPMERAIRDSGLSWVIVQPVALTHGPKTGRTRVALDGTVHGGFISRADVAAFAVNQLADDRYLRRAPVITSA